VRALVLGVCVLAAVPLAFWLPLPDLVRQLVAGSPGTWLLFSLVVVVLTGVLVPAIGIAHHRLVEPVLRTAQRIGSAPHERISMIKLQADMTSATGLIVRSVLALLACGLGAYLSLYPSGEAELLLVLSVAMGLVSVWHAALLVVKLMS